MFPLLSFLPNTNMQRILKVISQGTFCIHGADNDGNMQSTVSDSSRLGNRA